jgi:hypothetical protein
MFGEFDSEQSYYFVILLLQAPGTKNISNFNDRIETGLEHGHKIEKYCIIKTQRLMALFLGLLILGNLLI